MIYKIRILPYGCFLVNHNLSYYNMQNVEQIIDYFLPKINYIIVDKNEKADICITSICMENNDELRDNEINIMISVENLLNFNHYKHYNIFGEYNNKKIDIYIYSHIDKILENDNYLAIPCILPRINYFEQIIKKDNFNYCDNNFEQKKFCLRINKSGINNKISEVADKLSNYGKVDDISLYNNEISKVSCYNSPELLKILNKYKFIICIENSQNDGYITEKIFNCLLAKTIPIYWGSSKIKNYFNPKCFISIEENNWIDKVILLNKNEEEYNNYINEKKIILENYESYQKLILGKINKKNNLF